MDARSRHWIINTLVIFVMILSTQTTKSYITLPQPCDPQQDTFWYPRTGKCEQILKENVESCGAGRWLVLGANNVPRCQQMPCSDDTLVSVPNQEGEPECYEVNKIEPCPPGMQVVKLATGEGDCDCRSEMVFYRRLDNVTKILHDECHPLFRQGPCAHRHQLHIRPTEHQATCKPNVCKDGEVNVQVRYNGEVRLVPGRTRLRCIQLDTQCPAPAPDGTVLLINTTTNSLYCGMAVIRSRILIDAPVLNCPAGSRRDALNRCRRSV